MKYKHIKMLTETRLWMGQIIIPAISIGVNIMSNPEIKKSAKNGVDNVKSFTKKNFQKIRRVK